MHFRERERERERVIWGKILHSLLVVKACMTEREREVERVRDREKRLHSLLAVKACMTAREREGEGKRERIGELDRIHC